MRFQRTSQKQPIESRTLPDQSNPAPAATQTNSRATERRWNNAFAKSCVENEGGNEADVERNGTDRKKGRKWREREKGRRHKGSEGGLRVARGPNRRHAGEEGEPSEHTKRRGSALVEQKGWDR